MLFAGIIDKNINPLKYFDDLIYNILAEAFITHIPG
ncbi:hypothetical protein SDC9_81850 [bioreactor metagenome]|uniref:Uncharacterized protein n=1 Tax=bioreactor metagenome TaxID=1076179 RepID=A0A644Z312_9ZZZZ